MRTNLDAPILFVPVNLVHTGHINLGARTTADNKGPIGPSTVSNYSKPCIPKSIREARLGLAMRQFEDLLLVGDCLLRTLGLG
jgi:hypothetical protein